METTLTVLSDDQRYATHAMPHFSHKNKIAFSSLGTSLLVSIALWYTYPAITFGGRYQHHDIGSVYGFRDGRFYENGKDLGHYSVHLRSVTIRLNIEHANEPIHAKLGLHYISMPLPKYGQSVLRKRDHKQPTVLQCFYRIPPECNACHGRWFASMSNVHLHTLFTRFRYHYPGRR